MNGASSRNWADRAHRVIPGGVPGFHRLFGDGDPVFMMRGDGARVFDTDGRPYLDFVLGKGPVILGHAHQAVTEEVVQTIRDSPMLGLMSPVAVEAAEILLEDLPDNWRMRFHKSGSDACAAAVRMARARTDRRLILSSGYHGWHDWCSPGSPGTGGPADFADFSYDLDLLSALLALHPADVAAVMIEPQPGFLAPSFYADVAWLAKKAGALFILDEVKSAYRAGSGLTCRTLDQTPDLVVLGKAISNGFCVSCVAGSGRLMSLSDRLHVGSTYDFEAGPLAAIRATVPILRSLNATDALCAMAKTLAATLDCLFARHDLPIRAFATGAGFRLGFLATDLEEAFYTEAWKRGILFYPFDNQFLSLAHDRAILDEVTGTVDEILAAAARPNAGWNDVSDLCLHQFQSRKGFLSGAPGPDGWNRRAANLQQQPSS